MQAIRRMGWADLGSWPAAFASLVPLWLPLPSHVEAVNLRHRVAGIRATSRVRDKRGGGSRQKGLRVGKLEGSSVTRCHEHVSHAPHPAINQTNASAPAPGCAKTNNPTTAETNT